MCLGAPKQQKLPPTPPAPPTMADPAVQQSRTDVAKGLADSGLASTQLTVNLGGQGEGKKTLAGVK